MTGRARVNRAAEAERDLAALDARIAESDQRWRELEPQIWRTMGHADMVIKRLKEAAR
jgi:hypothetical protein